MNRLASLVSRTVAKSALGIDVVLRPGVGQICTRATWVRVEDDRDFLSTERTISDSILRIPAADHSEPRHGDQITVGAEPFFVDEVWSRHAVWLVSVTRRKPR